MAVIHNWADENNMFCAFKNIYILFFTIIDVKITLAYIFTILSPISRIYKSTRLLHQPLGIKQYNQNHTQ